MSTSVEFLDSNKMKLLTELPLFRGISSSQIASLLRQLDPRVQNYPPGALILLTGQNNSYIRIVLDGEIIASKISPGGSAVTMAQMGPGGVFGDVLSGSSTPSPVTVTASQSCTILSLSYERIIECNSPDPDRTLLLRNLVENISDKYFSIYRRLDLLILKSLRAKLCAWLLEQYHQCGSPMFRTHFTRGQLAEYLNCERSALSRELSRMQAEGLLETHRGSFKLLNIEAIQSQYEGEVFS